MRASALHHTRSPSSAESRRVRRVHASCDARSHPQPPAPTRVWSARSTRASCAPPFANAFFWLILGARIRPILAMWISCQLLYVPQ